MHCTFQVSLLTSYCFGCYLLIHCYYSPHPHWSTWLLVQYHIWCNITSCPIWNLLLGRAWASPTLAWLHCAHACVCLSVCLSVCLQPYTENFKWALLNFNITKIKLGVWSWSLKARVHRRLPGVEMTEVEVHMATYSRRQVAHRHTNLITAVVEVTSGKDHA